jgi:hypothetical protein
MVGNRIVTGTELAADPKVQGAAIRFPEADIVAIPLHWIPGLGPRMTGPSDPFMKR